VVLPGARNHRTFPTFELERLREIQMTQLRKDIGARTGFIHEKPSNDNPPKEAKAGIPLREARERAEIERVPGGKESSDADSVLQNPPEAAVRNRTALKKQRP
jgi:hypothetical protein